MHTRQGYRPACVRDVRLSKNLQIILFFLSNNWVIFNLFRNLVAWNILKEYQENKPFYLPIA